MRFPAAPVLPGSEEDCTVAGRRRKDASDPAFRIHPHVRGAKLR